MNAQTGKYIIIIGMLMVLAGLLVYFFHDKLHWIGRLPGDIRIERKNFRFYLPVTSMIIASVIITLIVQVIRRLF